MKRIISLSALLFLFANAFSQAPIELNDNQRVIDSLKNVFSVTKSDSLKCITSFELSRIHIGYDLYLAKTYLDKANKLIKNNQYLKDVSYYYNAPIKYYISKDIDGYLKALSLANEKLKKYNAFETNLMRLKTLINMSVVYGWKNNTLESKRIQIEEAIPLAESINNNELLGAIYTSLAMVFFNGSDFKKAEYYGNLSIKKLEEKRTKSTKYSENLFISYTNYAETLSVQKKFNAASAILIKAFEIIKDYPNSNLYCNYYYSMSFFELKKANYDKAMHNVNKGIERATSNEDFFLLYKLKLMKIDILKKSKKYGKAKDLMIEALKSEYASIEEKKNNTKELAFLYKQLKDFSNSVIYYQRYIELNDSIVGTTTKKEILALEAKFNKIENEKKISALEAEKKQAELIAKKNKLYYWVFGLFSFLLLIIAALFWKNIKAQKYLALEKEINYDQNLKSLKNLKDIEIMEAVIDGEEAERKRIARDLHDGIGSRLSAIKMKLNQANKTENQTIETQNFSDLLSHSIDELKQISYNLMPETLLKFGLESALKDLCHSLSAEAITINFQANAINEYITQNHQIAIFRIIQELINNALKHSKCTEIIVDCNQNENLFLITVEDNGIGFNSHDLGNSIGLGLKNVKSRIDLLNGKFELKSQIGKGTIYNIELLVQIRNE